MKDKKSFFGHTWSGLIFGVILLGILLGTFVGAPIAITMTHFYPESNGIAIGSIVSGVIAGLSVMAKRYWNWADRAMAKLFGSNGNEQAG